MGKNVSIRKVNVGNKEKNIQSARWIVVALTVMMELRKITSKHKSVLQKKLLEVHSKYTHQIIFPIIILAISPYLGPSKEQKLSHEIMAIMITRAVTQAHAQRLHISPYEVDTLSWFCQGRNLFLD